ncbi:MAG: RidA family protein [Gemmatimonadaceae bacterium]
MSQRFLLPDGWSRPAGYSHGIATTGTQIFVAGQIGWDADKHIDRENFVAQARQSLLNIVAILHAGGAKPEHVVRLTWYVLSAEQYRASSVSLGAAYRAVMGHHYPVMTAVQVVALMEPDALVEIEATAVIPDGK